MQAAVLSERTKLNAKTLAIIKAREALGFIIVATWNNRLERWLPAKTRSKCIAHCHAGIERKLNEDSSDITDTMKKEYA